MPFHILQQQNHNSIHTRSQKMDSTKLTCLLLTLLFAVATSANNGAPAPAVDCSTLILEMADCLSYVSEGGTASKPVKSCCSGLKKVLKTDAECLCETFRNSAQLGVTLNMTKATNLPSACHVSAPSITNCGLSIGAAPGLSPMLAPTSSVAAAPTAGISGFGAAPSPAPTSGLGSSSGSSALATSIELFVFSTLLAAVSIAFF